MDANKFHMMERRINKFRISDEDLIGVDDTNFPCLTVEGIDVVVLESASRGVIVTDDESVVRSYKGRINRRGV